jgi:hypothetical protein
LASAAQLSLAPPSRAAAAEASAAPAAGPAELTLADAFRLAYAMAPLSARTASAAQWEASAAQRPIAPDVTRASYTCGGPGAGAKPWSRADAAAQERADRARLSLAALATAAGTAGSTDAAVTSSGAAAVAFTLAVARAAAALPAAGARAGLGLGARPTSSNAASAAAAAAAEEREDRRLAARRARLGPQQQRYGTSDWGRVLAGGAAKAGAAGEGTAAGAVGADPAPWATSSGVVGAGVVSAGARARTAAAPAAGLTRLLPGQRSAAADGSPGARSVPAGTGGRAALPFIDPVVPNSRFAYEGF